jgi:transposase InsO family protein/site-specific DNA-cytosine methylase
MYAVEALTSLFNPDPVLPVLPADASEDAVMEYFAEIAALQQEAIPPAAITDAHSYGTITTDKEHLFQAVACSMHGETSVKIPGLGNLLDSGAKLSCISQTAANYLVRVKAASLIDIKNLHTAKLLAGFNETSPSAKVTKAVVLRLTDPKNEQFHIVHTFLIVPNLGYPLILGRDFLNAHVYKANHDGSGNVIYDFSPNAPRINSIETPGIDKLPYYTADQSKKWVAVLRESIDTARHHRNYLEAAVQIFEQGGTTPAQAAPSQDVEITFFHPSLRQRNAFTGVSYSKVFIEVNANTGIISKGTIIGTAVPMHKHITTTDPHQTTPAKPRVAEVFGGCGSFAVGASEKTNVKIVASASAEVLSRAHVNLPAAQLLHGNLTTESDKAAFVKAAQQLEINMLIGGPPCTTKGTTGELDTLRLAAFIELTMRVKSIRFAILETYIGLLSRSELDLILALAHAHGLITSFVEADGSHCGLSTTRAHAFIMFAKPSAEQHARAEWQAIMARTKHLVLAEHGAEPLISVASALDQGIMGAEEYYYFSQHMKDSPSIFSMHKPAPSFRRASWQRQVPDDYEPHVKDAVQDATRCRATKPLSWAALKRVSSFPTTYFWPEESEKGKQATALQMLARAVPPALAEFVLDALERAGMFHYLAEQGNKPTPPVATATPPQDDPVVPPEEGERDATKAASSSSAKAEDPAPSPRNPARKRPAPKPPHEYVFSIKFVEDLRIQQKQQLEEKLGVKLDEEGKLPPDPHRTGGTPLSSYKSAEMKVNQLLDETRPKLPPHLLEVLVDFDGWTAEQVSKVCALLLSTQDMFSVNKWDIGQVDLQPFHIQLREGARPVADRPYRYSPKLTQLVKVEIDKLLAAGIIRPSMSEWASPVVAVLKPDGTARITVNFKKLNQMTVVPKIPLPNIDDVLQSLGGSTVYSTMDITSGYFTAATDPQSIPLTACVTQFGLFEWTRVPQGAAGAPGYFQQLIARVLQGLDHAQPFIDDVIVNSKDVDQHIKDLAVTLNRLKDTGFKLAPKKMHIGCKVVNFLGHTISAEGIRPDRRKVEALLSMPTPDDLSALRAYLGLAGYYRRFIKSMAQLSASLTALTGKDVPFVIGQEQLDAIQAINQALALQTLMTFPDYAAASDGSRPFILATDACKVGFGAVLSQQDVNKKEHPIAFASRTTLKNERNWSVTDLEAGAVIYGIKKFRHMLWGTPFLLYTDHRALLYIETMREKTARAARWHEFLNAFPHTIKYREGKLHGNADGPSRNPIPATEEDEKQAAEEATAPAYAISESQQLPSAATSTSRSSAEVKAAEAYGVKVADLEQVEDKAFSELTSFITAITETMSEVATDQADEEHAAEHAEPTDCWHALSEHKQLGLMTVGEWSAAQQQDDQVNDIWQCVSTGTLPDITETKSASYVNRIQEWSNHCFLQECGSGQVLMRHEWRPSDPAHEQDPYSQLVVPERLRNQVLDALHGSPWAGHQGINRTLVRVRQHAWWPGWTQAVKYWCTHCWPCQARKRYGKFSKLPTVWRELPPHAHHTIGIDFFGPLPTSKNGHVYILVIQDLYSRWVEAYPLTPEEFNSAGTARIIVDKYCTQHGPPAVILSDRGSQFMSELAAQVYKFLGARKLSTTAYSPQTNGKTERFMQTLAAHLAMVVNGTGSDWDEWLPHVTFAYNSSEHAATGVSPFLLAKGREPRIALHAILGQFRHHLYGDKTKPSETIQEIIEQVTHKQRIAQGIMSKRHDLRRAKVLAQNEELAEAFGLRLRKFKVGEKAWWYKPPITNKTAAQDDTGTFGVLSKKLKDQWVGPYTILKVGPTQAEGEYIQANNLMIQAPEGPTRVHVRQCKPCRDPAVDPKPSCLPEGMARFLLSRHRQGYPVSLALEDVDPEGAWERHGVQTVLKHRVARYGTHQAQVLQYLVRWEGHNHEDSWESERNLDACPEVLNDYWQSLAHAGVTPTDANVKVVKAARLKAKNALRLTQDAAKIHDNGSYELPAGVFIVPKKPTAAKLRDISLLKDLHFMQVWRFEKGTDQEYTAWCAGRLIRAPSGRDKFHRVKFDDGSEWKVNLTTHKYGSTPNAQDATESEWFLFGTADQIKHLTD